MPSQKILEQKTALVASLAERLKAATAGVLVQYEGISVEDDTKLRAGQVIQSCLKETIGVDVALESMDLATYLDKTASGDYQAAIGGYTSSDMLSYAKGVYQIGRAHV